MEIRETILTIICMYCKKYMGEKPGLGVSGDTSSICPECWKERFPGVKYPEECG